MAARQIVVEFLGSDKSLSSTAKDATTTTSRLGDTLKNVGKVAAVGLAAGAVFAGKALADMTKNAIEDEAAQRKLALGLKNATGATAEQIAGVEDWIATQGRALGVTDDEIRPAFQRLVESTGSIKEAQKQMGIAFDVSAGTGKSLKTVTEAMMKANNGTTASLSRLGLKTKDANGETLTLDQAMKSMADTFGGQAAAKAATLEGKMARLKIIFDETKEEIGAKLIPILSKMADWFLAEGLPAIEKFGGWMKDSLIPAIVDMGKTILSTIRFLDEHKVAIGAAGAALAALTLVVKLHSVAMAVSAAGGMAAWITGTNIITGLTTVWTGVQWALNIAMRANPIGLVVTALAALGLALTIAYKKSETFRDIIRDAMDAVRDVVRNVLGSVREFIQNWASAVVDAVRNGWDNVKDAFRAAGGVLVDVTRNVWDTVKDVVRNGWDTIKEAVRNGWDAVKDAFRAAGGVLVDVTRNVWDTVKDVVRNGWDAIRESVRNGWDNIKEAFRSAGGVLMDVMRNVWETLKEAVRNGWEAIKEVFRASGGAMVDIMRNVWSGARDIIGDGISSIVDMIRSVPDRIRSLVGGFGNVGEALIGALVNGMKNAGGVVAGIAGNVWSAVKGMLNSAISQINAALEFRISLPGPDIEINPPNIPYLAKGGIVTKPTLALIGEAGPEAVVPLTGSYARNAGMSSAAPSEENITVVLQLDGREIHRSLVKRKRTLGTTLGLA